MKKGDRYHSLHYFSTNTKACCGMALRMSPTNKRDKERLRQLQPRREEQDSIIRIIKGTKKESVQLRQFKWMNISQLFHNQHTTFRGVDLY
jgi:hypothetical protein